MSKKTDLKKFLIENSLYEQGMTLEQMEACLLSSNLQDAFFIKPKKGNEPNGNEPNGNEPNGNEPNGNEPNGNEPNGNEPNGNEPNGNEPNGNEPNGNEPNGSHDELFEAIKNSKASNQTQEATKPLVEKKNRKIGKKESNPDSFRLQGYVLLLMIDTIFPFMLSFVNNMFEKRFKIDAHELKLEERNFKELEPLADAAADYIAININPVAGFLIVAGFMYGGQLISIRSVKLSELPIEVRNPRPKQNKKPVRK